MGLSSVAKDVLSAGSVKRIIRTKYFSEKATPPLNQDSWLRASAFAGLCPREEVLCSLNTVTRTETLRPDNMLILLHGRALHWGIQNHLLPELGLLVGKWQCLTCAAVYGGTPPLVENLVYRPDECTRCKGTEFLYQELMLYDDKHRVNGHPDGFLIVPGLPGIGVIEAKSIGSNGAIAVRQGPQIGHVIQAHIYMWLMGFQWAKIFYWDKGGQGVSAIIEHHIDRDEEIIAKIKQTALSIWEGIRTGKLPDRVCANAECSRARSCVVRDLCFAP